MKNIPTTDDDVDETEDEEKLKLSIKALNKLYHAVSFKKKQE